MRVKRMKAWSLKNIGLAQVISNCQAVKRGSIFPAAVLAGLQANAITSAGMASSPLSYAKISRTFTH
jgi:hypothetical protein